MANPEHLEILKQGIDVWNEWRKENPSVYPDLSGAKLSNAFLVEANLSRANLKGSDFHEAHLRKAQLVHSDMSDAALGGATLNEALLAEANLNRAILISTELNLAVLSKATLVDASLRKAELYKADLRDANLSGADLYGANLLDAILDRAIFNKASLTNASFESAKLLNATLTEASMGGTNFSWAVLDGADLRRAKLITANFSNAKLSGTNFRLAESGYTIFANVDLSHAEGLEKVYHRQPSSIGTNTIQLSKGEIPEEFLRGCGLNDCEIESSKLYAPDLSNQEIDEILYRMHDLRANQALQISPLFISYSHADGNFVNTMEGQLTGKGIRFWRDVHHATAGRLEKQIDMAIRHNPTVLVILSENSTQSDWVEHEVRTARNLEKELDRDVLCPIALDDSWKSARWPARIMEQLKEYNILDFSGWEDDNEFEKQFGTLIDGLDIFYK